MSRRIGENRFFVCSLSIRRIARSWIRGSGFIAFVCLTVSVATVHAQGAWQVELVDDGHGDNVGKYSSLAIDVDGNLHIAYFDESKNALRYAYRGNGDQRWFTMQVDKQAGQFASLAVDSHDHPLIAYNSRFLTGLHYAFFDGTDWHTEIIDHDRTNHLTSIQVDARGHPHISYYKEENPDGTYALHLKYAFFDGQTWYIKTVSDKFATGKFNSIALDASDRPHIAYSFQGAGDLGYAFWDGSQWIYEVPDTRRTHNDYVGEGNSIAIDSKGNAHIAYWDLNNQAIKYTHWTGTIWQTEVVDKVSGELGQADRVSLKLDSHDQPRIAYYDSGIGGLKYAHRDGEEWHVEVVDKQGNVGEYPSLSLDKHDQPYISFYDASASQLRLIYLETTSSVAISAEKK